eukprot:4556725-Prymnesium_polylepis.1
MVTCTCPSRGQSSDAIIYAVTQIAFRQPSRKGREHRRNQTAKVMTGYHGVPERDVAPPQSNRERKDCFF